MFAAFSLDLFEGFMIFIPGTWSVLGYYNLMPTDNVELDIFD